MNVPRINVPGSHRSPSGSQRSSGVAEFSSRIFLNDNASDFARPLFSDGFFSPCTSVTSVTNLTPSADYRTPVTEVTSQLFFGSFDDATNEENLKKLGITHIISLIGNKHPVEGMKLKHKPMNDYGRTDLKRVIKTLWSFVVESQKPFNKLFVHCHSGQNRSATVVITILMKLKSGPKNLKEAYRMVKKKRPIVQINEKYARQLSELESELFGVTSMPNDWMSVHTFCMNTGKVVFLGEGFTPTPHGSKQRAMRSSPSRRYPFLSAVHFQLMISDSSETELLD